MYGEVAWVLVSLGTQVQPQITFDPDYLPDYLSVSYYYSDTLNSKNLSRLYDINITSVCSGQYSWGISYEYLPE